MDERRKLEKLPSWVPNYLDCWRSRTDPDGRRMTVNFAAEHAGVTPGAVRSLRMRSASFKRMEYIVRRALRWQRFIEKHYGFESEENINGQVRETEKDRA